MVCKEYGSIVDVCIPLKKSKSGFQSVKLRYLGGLWVLIELDSLDSVEKFQNHVGVGSWFSLIKPDCNSFVSDERIVWISVEGKVHWLRAKELDAWVPKFLSEEECDSSKDGESDDFGKGRNFGDMEFDNAKSNAESDVEKVSESSCMRETNSAQVKIPITSHEDTPQSTDPFNIYDLLQKKKVVTPQPNESDPTYPSGFTPKENHNDGENTVSPKDQVNSTPSTNLHSCHNIALSSQRNFSTPISGGSILDVMDDLIKVGILCVWDPNMFIREHVSSSDYFLVVMGTWSSTSTKLLVISMYAPQELTEKRDLWDYLCMMIDRWEGETVILGDFNEVRTEQERFGSIFNTQGANAFNNFISKSDLFDLSMGGYSYTWSHKSATKMSKLDVTFLNFKSFYNSYYSSLFIFVRYAFTFILID
nr:RNA-directed DNA polymerase, eukaryota [Tanacetum cinerariifolium]